MAVTENQESLDILSSVWIFASNDENHLVTYEGVKYRLGLNSAEEVKNIVKKHGELFRFHGGRKKLEEWKSEMRNKRQLPSWISAIENREQQLKKIDSLTSDAIFRSQFRCEDGKRSSIEIIEWGIKHIDRLREIKANESERKLKRITTYIIPLLSSLIGFAGLLSGFLLQRSTIDIQKQTQSNQLYQVELKPKLDKYAVIANGLDSANIALHNGDPAKANLLFDRLPIALTYLDPFLYKAAGEKQSALLHQSLEHIRALGSQLELNSSKKDQRALDSTMRLNITNFKKRLRSELFK